MSQLKFLARNEGPAVDGRTVGGPIVDDKKIVSFVTQDLAVAASVVDLAVAQGIAIEVDF